MVSQRKEKDQTIRRIIFSIFIPCDFLDTIIQHHYSDAFKESRMTITISDIVPTQDYIRNEKQIPGMIKFIKSGGFFTKEAIESHKPNSSFPHSLIRLSQFDDGTLFLSDGHHRVIAMLAGGRDELHSDEFFIERWSYAAYQEVVFTYPDGRWMGWITPHNPWEEIRLPELGDFKFQVKAIWIRDGADAALDYIQSNKSKYCKPRTIRTIQELYENYMQMSQTSGPFNEKYKELSKLLEGNESATK